MQKGCCASSNSSSLFRPRIDFEVDAKILLLKLLRSWKLSRESSEIPNYMSAWLQTRWRLLMWRQL